MTLEEAIEIQETVLGFTEDDEPKGIIQSTKLGIEALKRFKEVRANPLVFSCSYSMRMLPGETEE